MNINRLIIATTLALLAGCSGSPEIQLEEKNTVEIIAAHEGTQLTAFNPDEAMTLAENNEDWGQLSHLVHKEWMLAGEVRKQRLEQRLWLALSQLSQQSLKTLILEGDKDLAAWATFAEIAMQAKPESDPRLLDLMAFYPDSILHQSFIKNWLQQNAESKPLNIAVLLPTQGQYQSVAHDIKQGIIKAFFAHGQTNISIRFYDTSNPEQTAVVYQTALNDGANKIIGPLQPESLQQIRQLAGQELLALNRLEDADFFQFSLKSSDEISQLIAGMSALGERHVGVISSSQPSDLEFAYAFRKAWLEHPNHLLEIYQSKETQRQLREQLGSLMNETLSQARAKKLRRLVEKFDSEPRTRHDLDAILFVDRPHNVAVYNPQLTFYQSPVNVYGTTNLVAKTADSANAKQDFKNIRLVTPPFSIEPNHLDNIFQAFGWDSYWVSYYLDELQKGYCLNISQTGKLSLEDNLVHQQLIWSQFDQTGQLTASQVFIAPNEDVKQSEISPIFDSELTSNENLPLLDRNSLPFTFATVLFPPIEFNVDTVTDYLIQPISEH